MIEDATVQRVMRNILWTVATILGSFGVAAVWGSFHNPACSIDAFLTLPVAVLITLTMPPPASPRPHRR